MLLGAWAPVFRQFDTVHSCHVTIHHCPTELRALRHALASKRPTPTGMPISRLLSRALRHALASKRPIWLLVGEGGEDEALFALVAAARRMAPEIRIAVLGPADDIDRCESWLRRGARVYFAGTTSVEGALADPRHALDHDRLVIDACFQRELLKRQRALGLGMPGEPGWFTSREGEVLQLMCQGQRNADIAAALHVTGDTVEFHVHSILAKLGARNRTEAAEYARLLGLSPDLRKTRG